MFLDVFHHSSNITNKHLKLDAVIPLCQHEICFHYLHWAYLLQPFYLSPLQKLLANHWSSWRGASYKSSKHIMWNQKSFFIWILCNCCSFFFGATGLRMGWGKGGQCAPNVIWKNKVVLIVPLIAVQPGSKVKRNREQPTVAVHSN